MEGVGWIDGRREETFAENTRGRSSRKIKELMESLRRGNR
jgi:hypothetical protein